MFDFSDETCPKLHPDVHVNLPQYSFYAKFSEVSDYGCSIACAYPKGNASFFGGNVLITVLICIRLMYELKALIYHGRLYLKDAMNYLEMVLYAASLFYVWGDSFGILKTIGSIEVFGYSTFGSDSDNFFDNSYFNCTSNPDETINLIKSDFQLIWGSIAILLSWMNLLLFIRQFPRFGIYSGVFF